MRAEIYIILDLERHEGVDILRQEHKTVVASVVVYINLTFRELVNVSAAPEAEILEHGERSFNGQAAHVHFSGLFYNMVGVVRLVYRYRNSVRSVGELGHGVYYKSVVALAVV